MMQPLLLAAKAASRRLVLRKAGLNEFDTGDFGSLHSMPCRSC